MNIPGWKNEQELEFGAVLCKLLEPDSIIVEIGASAGRLTWVLSESAPTSNVYAIDLWCGTKKFVGNGYDLDSDETNTLEYFNSFMLEKLIENVITLKTDSLTYTWIKEPIDLIFIDPDDGYGKTDLKSHLEHWYPHVKEGGTISGFNWYEHRDDVREQLIEFTEKHNKELLVDISTGWKFLK